MVSCRISFYPLIQTLGRSEGRNHDHDDDINIATVGISIQYQLGG